MKLSNLVPNKFYYTRFCTLPLTDIIRESDGTTSVASLWLRPAYYYVNRSGALVGMSVKTFISNFFETPVRAFNATESTEFGSKLDLSLLSKYEGGSEEQSLRNVIQALLAARQSNTDTIQTIALRRLEQACEEHEVLNYESLAQRINSPHLALCFLATGWVPGDMRYNQFRSSIDLLESEGSDIDYRAVLLRTYDLEDATE